MTTTKRYYVVSTSGPYRYLVKSATKRATTGYMRWDGNKELTTLMARSSAYEWANKMGGRVKMA